MPCCFKRGKMIISDFKLHANEVMILIIKIRNIVLCFRENFNEERVCLKNPIMFFSSLLYFSLFSFMKNKIAPDNRNENPEINQIIDIPKELTNNVAIIPEKIKLKFRNICLCE